MTDRRGRGRPPRPEPFWLDSRGYVVVRRADGSTAHEHRLVMESIIGRALAPGESVRHLNGDHADNRAENLQLLVTSPAGRPAAELVCPACGESYWSAVLRAAEAGREFPTGSRKAATGGSGGAS